MDPKGEAVAVHDQRRDLTKSSKLGNAGWHTFRHSALLSDGTLLEVQQKLLRYADNRTTIGYGELSMENKRAANARVVRAILIRKAAR